MAMDRDALVALFRSTGGAKWTRKDNWDTVADISQWFGVTTVNDQNRVVALSLVSNNLRGLIPVELENLAALEKLDLAWNKLSGPIPPELGNLRELKTLRLDTNQLTGPIPPQLGQLGALVFLGLARNKLDGTIPEALGELTALEELHLNLNNLSGPIPPELGNLGALILHNLSGNQLSGPIPSELGHLSALKELYLYNNQLSGAIPAQLGALTKLTRLSLTHNQLRGIIPTELGKLAALKFLNLAGNKLSVLPRAAAEALAAGKTRVDLSNNPWEEPPRDVVERGLTFAANYLKDLDDYGRTSSNRLKVVLVGLGNAGKTSLAIRLQGGNPDSLPTPEDRTVGVEIRDMKLGFGPANEGSGASPGLDLKVWDFAGQRAYYDTHQMFLTPDALFLLVVDMFAYSNVHSRKDALEQWLDILQSRVPGSVVLVVGTHSDSFASPATRNERMESFKRDLLAVTERIDCDCRRVNDTRRGHSHQDCKPIRVVKDVLAFNLSSSEQEEINELRDLVERVAYDKGYRFPSVRRDDVPTTHALAVATLEAVRRGADVAGSAGDQAEVLRRLSRGDDSKGRPFIKFSDALALFVDLWDKRESPSLVSSVLMTLTGTRRAKGTPALVDLEEAFLRAVELHQARGAILLTRVDGGGQWGHGRDASASVLGANLIIHVDPAWFADLVRRVVDVRLLDPAQQGSVLQALRDSVPVSSMLDLSIQHERFCHAGEVSRDYLKFLWLRDMNLGPSSTETPPLKMSEDDIGVMVDSLLDIRFMFPVKDEHGGDLPDLYVVASCLPEHAGCDVDPSKMLELDVGGAIFSQELELVGTHAMPPGLIPRLLAWCGRGQGRIQACWKRGVCFGFHSHLMLVYEAHNASGVPSISCHAMGSAHDEKARGALTAVVQELNLLVNDEVYGFRGIGLLWKGKTTKNRACSDDELEAMLARLESALEDHMNVRFDELSRKSDIIAGGIRDHLHAAEERMRSFEVNADANANALHIEIGKMKQEVFSKLDFVAAVTSKCLLISVADQLPCPRLIQVEEDASQPPARSRFRHFRRAMMDPFVRKRGKPKGKQSKPKRYRVRFLCAHDMSAADCGPDGQGYVLESEKEWQRWLRKCLPLIQVSLWLLRVGVSVVARADILPVDGMLGGLREVAGEEAAAWIEAVDLTSLDARNAGLSAKADKQVEIFDQAYDDLVAFVTEQENIALAASQSGVGGAAPVSTVTGRSFEKDMVLVPRQKDSDEPEWAWVRRVNVEKWKRFESPASAAQRTGSVP